MAEMKVLVEVSARHMHVSPEHLEILFGKGHKLTPKKELSQPGQYACEERVDVVGPKRELKGVTILGPERSATQVEISLTDARSIGVSIPIRESGDTAGSAGCILRGPAGEVELKEGLIAAKRHIHIHTDKAAEWGLKENQVVSVRVDTPERSLMFGDTIVRIREDFVASMHVDTDEGNAAAVSGECYGEIIVD